MRFVNLVHPGTCEAVEQVKHWLFSNDYEVLFLDLPQVYDPSDLSLSRGLKVYQPLLQALRVLASKGISVYFYLSPRYQAVAKEVALEFAALTLRARLGRIEPEQWKEVAKKEVKAFIQSLDEHTRYIATRAKSVNVCVNLPAEVKEEFLLAGHKVEEIVVDVTCKPMDIFWQKVKEEELYGKKFSQEEAKKLIEQHVEFVGLILEKDFDEAYKIWKQRVKCNQ